MKVIFFSYLNKEEDCTVYDIVNEIADIDAKETESATITRNIELKEVAHEWRLEAA